MSRLPLGTIADISSHAQKARRDAATLARFDLQNVARKLLPTERVSNCLRAIVPTENTVLIKHDAAAERAYYSHLRTCDNVWVCPICAAKITERRKVALQKAVSYAYNELKLTPMLATFTLEHHLGESLASVLASLRDAFRGAFSGRWYANFKEGYGLRGFVRSTEVTYGANGWHPHYHVLLFFESPADTGTAIIKQDIKDRWDAIRKRLQLRGLRNIACDVRDADTDVYGYIAKFGHEAQGQKWTVEHELTKAPSKMASGKGCTPFGFLERFALGDYEAGRLFQEYAAVFKRSHQLQWAKGLKSLLAYDETGEDSAVNEHATLAEMSRREWYIFKNLPIDQRANLLNVAAAGDAAKVQTAIENALERGNVYADKPKAKSKENPFVWWERSGKKQNIIARQEAAIFATRYPALC